MTELTGFDFIRLAIDTTVEYEKGRPGPQAWHVRVETDDDQGRPTGVFWMGGWTFRLGAGHYLAGELDALSADTAVFIPLVEGDDVSQRLVDELDLVPLGDGLVLINHVRLDPEMRGRGGIAATSPAWRSANCPQARRSWRSTPPPFELRQEFDDGNVPDDVWEAGAEALGPVWESLGFDRFEGHLYVLDPTRTALDDAMTALRRRLGSA